MKEKKEPRKYEIPAGTFPTTCRAKDCGKRIYFVKTDRGGMLPVTEEGFSHFLDCPAAKDFSKRKRA